MFACERCGSKYHSSRAAALRDCPRCLLRDDVASPLTFVTGWGAELDRQKARDPVRSGVSRSKTEDLGGSAAGEHAAE